MLNILGRVSNESALVLHVLESRTKDQTKVKLDHDYIATSANVGILSIQRCLDELVDRELLQKHGDKYHLNDCVLTILPLKRSDKTVLGLEQEVASLQAQLAAKQGLDLATVLHGEDATLVREIEETSGRGLVAGEIYYIGYLIGQYGVGRTRLAYRQMKHQRYPIRAMYAMLRNGGMGKKFTKEEQPVVNYGTVVNTNDL